MGGKKKKKGVENTLFYFTFQFSCSPRDMTAIHAIGQSRACHVDQASFSLKFHLGGCPPRPLRVQEGRKRLSSPNWNFTDGVPETQIALAYIQGSCYFCAYFSSLYVIHHHGMIMMMCGSKVTKQEKGGKKRRKH